MRSQVRPNGSCLMSLKSGVDPKSSSSSSIPAFHINGTHVSRDTFHAITRVGLSVSIIQTIATKFTLLNGQLKIILISRKSYFTSIIALRFNVFRVMLTILIYSNTKSMHEATFYQ